jgi:elongator complex protein 3
METLLLDIIAALQAHDSVDERELERIIRRHNSERAHSARDVNSEQARSAQRVLAKPLAKKRILPYYLKTKEFEPEHWATWGVDEALEQRLIRTLRVKPRRTASGVATITVLTKPWPCSNDCRFCPRDVRMPKSYLHDEPACQRAERNYFDPYLQVVSRLRALTHMGHATSKVELIILGGTWQEYPMAYRLWFVTELFRALNTEGGINAAVRQRRGCYRAAGVRSSDAELTEFTAAVQQAVEQGRCSYNEAVKQLWGRGERVKPTSMASLERLLAEQQHLNETAAHRSVGLVVETRPNCISPASLLELRHLGCTKVQLGVQSLDAELLARSGRRVEDGEVERAFELLRAFGFKIHAHFMVNLPGATPEGDRNDYERLVAEEALQPDEVKLYPCALIRGTHLCEDYATGAWQPYGDEELLSLLVADTLATPAYCRISRMIRDFSAVDILAGNKMANLRQLVEARLALLGAPVKEIRYREINAEMVDYESLELVRHCYLTSNTKELFCEWVTPSGHIAGFLRLSLPTEAYLREHEAELPVSVREAMIREVHVYGAAARLDEQSGAAGREEVIGEETAGGEVARGAQHRGLGKQLIEEASELARAHGYERLNVISAVGTREYYRNLGFYDVNEGLYLQKALN